MTSQIKNSIVETLQNLNSNKAESKTIYSNTGLSGSNEFLFFIKPEIVLLKGTEGLSKALDLILAKIEEFKLNIKNVRVINAKYLEEYNIIAQHYGVINQISNSVEKNISDDAKLKFTELYGIDYQNASVLGSLEFIKAFPYFDPTGLDYLWQNGDVKKLAGGTYSQKLTLDGKEVYLVDGFHPRQLEHFIKKGRSIITFTLMGDLDWSEARNGLIGKTNPADAAPGSIRRELLENKDLFGLQAVTPSWNGVHLSAGPVEGLIELIRYNSDFSSNNELKAEDFSFGRLLLEKFGEEKTKFILQNPDLSIDGKQISVFDLTEEMNSPESLELLS